MRTSAKYLTGLLALGLSMGGAAASAVEPSGVFSEAVLTSWSWHPPVQSQESARDKAISWLRIADEAMEKGDWQGASVAVTNAERLERQMASGEQPITYNSAAARRRLQQMQSSNTQQTPAAPGQLQLPPLSANGDMQATKQQASRLIAQAQAALDRNDLLAAQQLTAQARALNVADDMFLPNETRPWQMELAVRSAMERRGVAQANYQGGQATGAQNGVQQSVYRPNNDPNQYRQVSNEQQGSTVLTGSQPTVSGQRNRAVELVDMARRALDNNDSYAARDYFTQAMRMQDQLDLQTRQYVQSQLTSLNTPNTFPQQDGATGIEEIDSQQQLLLQRIGQDIFREQAVAQRMAENRDPRGALDHLTQLRERVSHAEVDQASKQYYLNIVDRYIREMEQYIERNIIQIQNDERNASRLQDVQNRRQHRVDVENQLAGLIEEFNRLVDERRYPEAEVIARQAYQLAPEYPEVEVVMWKAKFLRRVAENEQLVEFKEQAVLDTLSSVDRSAVPFDDSTPYLHGDARTWEELSMRRMRQLGERGVRSPEEMQILQQLRTTPIAVQFEAQPLSVVLSILSERANLNIDMDLRAMQDQGISSDAPITVNFSNEIYLESALNLILEKVGLTYQVRNQVIQVTTEEMKNRNVYPETYFVGDLVVPIPNFVPSNNIGLTAAISDAYRTQRVFGRSSGSVPPVNIAGMGNGTASALDMAMAQQGLPALPFNNNGAFPNGPVTGMNPGGNMGFGPGGMGGGINADFDSLIELITNTIAVDEWDEVGGPGHIEEFRANLSLVISQTQEVHEQIQDLLDQLRRLQDLQITIEVRFITLQDDFFERIGVDFDFDIRNGQQVPQDAGGVFQLPTAGGPSLTVGRQPVSNIFNPTADLDLQFTQESFASAVPQFGGFDANTAANFGFAILSDIEVFMLLQASTGDTRTNIMQAPKVTMFNGQTASVNDTAQRPFVTSVVPVVGDFAAAQQPIIVVLNEGTQLSVQAVASNDRRFVRMTLVPFFSQIGDVEEFTFEGEVTTNSGTAVVDPSDPEQTLQDGVVTTMSGTTVQLPVFGFTSISTTVSVPDGGTVLLGGIKRLQEGRNERGVPVLSNVPYVNRLFKNVGIGRTTSSLMMMVTPRIIIQEEEEINQVGAPGN